FAVCIKHMVTTPKPAPSENRNRSNKMLFMLSFLLCCDFFCGSCLLFNQLFVTLCELCMVQNIFEIRCPVGVVYLLQDFPSRGNLPAYPVERPCERVRFWFGR